MHKIILQEENWRYAKAKSFLHSTNRIFAIKIKRGVSHMAKNSVPEAKDALNRFKMEAAQEVGVNLTNGYNGNLTSKEAGSIGGQMVKKMIQAYENSMK